LAEYTRLSSALEKLSGRPSAPPLTGLLLFGLLEDKMRQALERALRLFQILHPREDFRRVYYALLSNEPQGRVAATEILEVTSLGYGEQIRGLLRLLSDKSPASNPEAQAPTFDVAAELNVLTSLLADPDPLVGALASAYAKELDIAELEPAIEEATRNNAWLIENGGETPS
jgi:hypothetical protein